MRYAYTVLELVAMYIPFRWCVCVSPASLGHSICPSPVIRQAYSWLLVRLCEDFGFLVPTWPYSFCFTVVVCRLCAVQCTGPFSRASACCAPRRTGTEVHGMSDADGISYLNRTTVPVIVDESLRPQLQELSRPQHHHKWPRAGAWGALRRTGTSEVFFKIELIYFWILWSQKHIFW